MACPMASVTMASFSAYSSCSTESGQRSQLDLCRSLFLTKPTSGTDLSASTCVRA